MNKKYKYIQLGIASPDEIRGWSHGEVKDSETINYRSYLPTVGGLFCERIFGPMKDYQCGCGKKKTKDQGTVCEKCGVEIVSSKVRRERLGHIELSEPVIHPWFLRTTPSKIATLLDIRQGDLETVANFQCFVVFDSGSVSEIKNRKIISEQEYAEYREKYGSSSFVAETGGRAIKRMLQEIDLEKTAELIKSELVGATKMRRERLIKRLNVIVAFIESGNKPEWMVLDVIPVLPPDLRPMVQLDGGRFATTDLNDLYKQVLFRNNRLKAFKKDFSTPAILKNEMRIVQQAVWCLIDNSKQKTPNKQNNRILKSLSDTLRGKQGRFRQNLLGKRVDFSGRSVIAVGPDLKMYQCGIPREMALILFKPFIIHNIIQESKKQALEGNDKNLEKTVKAARNMVEDHDPEAMEQLEKIVVEHPVLLNRAPTLHRLGIQAFEPKLVEGKAIRLHPLVTPAFNADFDGDQMAVHVPISIESQTEARLLMLASKNILAPKDGKPIVTPSQDMVLGNYYLTIEKKDDPRNGRFFKNPDEVMIALENKEIALSTRIFIPTQSLENCRFRRRQENSYLLTTPGKIIFNTIFPVVEGDNPELEVDKMPFVNEATRFNLTDEVDDKFILKPGRDPKRFINEWKYDYEISDEAVSETQKVLKLIKKYYNLKQFDQEFFKTTIKKFPIDNKHIKLILSEKFLDIFDPNKIREQESEENLSSYLLKTLKEKLEERYAPKTIPHPFTKKFLSLIISEVFKKYKLAETSKTLDKMKDLGFKYSTVSGITVSIFDIDIIDSKKEAMAQADKKVSNIETHFRHGYLDSKQKDKEIQKVWLNTKKQLENDISEEVRHKYLTNHIYIMSDSGARGNVGNFVQLLGIRGLMNKPNGGVISVPVRSSFREGLTMAEFFMSSHGSRKGSTDTALKTAESGYLTRRLVDVSQDVVIREHDCGTDKGRIVSTIVDDDGTVIEPLLDRISGRFSNQDVYIKNSKTPIVKKGQFITEKIAEEIVNAGIKEMSIRTLFTCDAKNGVCVKCYGSDLSTGEVVEIGEVVGIIAAQSIGEPGTQLTMRTFHSGGVAGEEDITQGLPRIQELFEARAPKAKAIISSVDGVVTDIERDQQNRISINVRHQYNKEDVRVLKKNNRLGDVEVCHYQSYINQKTVKSLEEGSYVQAGDPLTEGLIHPKELVEVQTLEAVENYILREVQKVYRSQNVGISDKHIEIIIKQMTQKVIVIDSGDTDHLVGSYITKSQLPDIICKAIHDNKRPPVVKPLLLGITRASLRSDSFLSAASFQETTRVLTEAAMRGKKDSLEGLKENIVIGGLIPAGTGIAEANLELENK